MARMTYRTTSRNSRNNRVTRRTSRVQLLSCPNWFIAITGRLRRALLTKFTKQVGDNEKVVSHQLTWFAGDVEQVERRIQRAVRPSRIMVSANQDTRS